MMNDDFTVRLLGTTVKFRVVTTKVSDKKWSY